MDSHHSPCTMSVNWVSSCTEFLQVGLGQSSTFYTKFELWNLIYKTSYVVPRQNQRKKSDVGTAYDKNAIHKYS